MNFLTTLGFLGAYYGAQGKFTFVVVCLIKFEVLTMDHEPVARCCHFPSLLAIVGGSGNKQLREGAILRCSCLQEASLYFTSYRNKRKDIKNGFNDKSDKFEIFEDLRRLSTQ